ncbi:MAG: 4a-hydroxytetrahydrobiopterin dehydratase, partial [Ferruginibacter sp.]
FISYRREDEGFSSRFIKAELERFFGTDQVFMDVDNIRIADNWMDIIGENLKRATILIAVIGKNWLRMQDEYYRRRIDNEDDWVRKEIEFALKEKITIVPFLIGCNMPDAVALPGPLKKITEFQAITLSASYWRNDMANLVALMKKNGFSESSQILPMPTPVKDMLFPLSLTIHQINEELKEFNGWRIVEYFSKEKLPQPGIAIEKVFEFESFEKAIGFINTVSKHISEIQHHPEWENLWKSVRIRLSTWDIGHKVCSLDISLAKFIEKEFSAINEI